ncbi:MAG: TRAP transporter substrate-binding protein [Bosea sp. (in: a-proteobacteria)]|nr:TRAP transporter substrate-binding protein [Bosea sp. (in: a-proteobacteria)]
MVGSTVASAQSLTQSNLNVIGSASFMPLYSEREQPFWTKTLAEKSDGKIAAQVRAFNEAGLKGTELFRLLQQGVADAATPILGYLAADDAMNEAVDLAGIAPTADVARAVSQAWEPVLDKHYRERNKATVLGVLAYPSQVLFCRTAFNGLSDLKGRKVRTGNRSLAELVESLGATSVTMPIGDVVPSLERGVVDCAITGSLTAYKQKWFDVVDNVYELGLGWSQLATVVSLKKWDSMSEADRQFLTTEYKALEAAVWDDVDKQTTSGFDCLTGQGPCPYGAPASMKLIKVTPADRSLLEAKLKETVVPAWAARCGKDCPQAWNSSIGKIINVTAN